MTLFQMQNGTFVYHIQTELISSNGFVILKCSFWTVINGFRE